jgi:cell division protein FtsZ
MKRYLNQTTPSHVTPRPTMNTIGQANIIIVGCGGAGNNTIDRMMKIGIKGARCVAINTDQQHLNAVQAHDHILIGKSLTRGLGAGGQPEIGRAAADESRAELYDILQHGDLVFVTCGMGGGTGTGSAPVVAELAKMTGAIVVGVVTLPFKAEMGRLQKAKEGIRNFRNFVDTLVVIDNNQLLEIAADMPLAESFSLADEVLATMVKGITETISMPSLINLDYADVRTILTSGGVAIVGIGEGRDPQNRINEAIEDALNSPLLEFDITGAKGALIHITGGEDLTLNETTKAANIITEKMDTNAMVIWGARIDPKMNGSVRVMLLITGVKSPQVLGNPQQMYLNRQLFGNNQYQASGLYNNP